MIKRSFENFNWQNAFLNCNPNEQVSVLTKAVLNIMSNFIPNETVLVDDRAILEYKQIKKCNPREKNKKHLKPNNQETLQAFSQIQERVRRAIKYSKKKKKYEKVWNKLLLGDSKTFFNGKKI